MRHPLQYLFVLILFFGSACSNGSGGRHDVVIDEIDGVTYVHNSTPIDTTDYPYRFVLEQVYGAEQEPAEEILASVYSMQIGSDGTLYVLDSGNHRIAAFDESGSLLWSAGSQGQGPGEFNRPS